MPIINTCMEEYTEICDCNHPIDQHDIIGCTGEGCKVKTTLIDRGYGETTTIKYT